MAASAKITCYNYWYDAGRLVMPENHTLKPKITTAKVMTI